MGMYTELILRCQLNDVPEKVSDMLSSMASGTLPSKLPEHEFFKCSRWRSIGHSNSYYFTPLSAFEFKRSPFDARTWFLIIACDLKNYDDEIKKFLDWIDPYLPYTEGRKYPVGWVRYEEDDEPTIIYTH